MQSRDVHSAYVNYMQTVRHEDDMQPHSEEEHASDQVRTVAMRSNIHVQRGLEQTGQTTLSYNDLEESARHVRWTSLPWACAKKQLTDKLGRRCTV